MHVAYQLGVENATIRCQAHLPAVLLFVFFSRVKLEARAAVAAAVSPGLPPLHLFCMLPGHGQQVLWDGCFGFLEGFHQVTGILIFIRRDEGNGCALVAGPPCSAVSLLVTEISAATEKGRCMMAVPLVAGPALSMQQQVSQWVMGTEMMSGATKKCLMSHNWLHTPDCKL